MQHKLEKDSKKKHSCGFIFSKLCSDIDLLSPKYEYIHLTKSPKHDYIYKVC